MQKAKISFVSTTIWFIDKSLRKSSIETHRKDLSLIIWNMELIDCWLNSRSEMKVCNASDISAHSQFINSNFTTSSSCILCSRSPCTFVDFGSCSNYPRSLRIWTRRRCPFSSRSRSASLVSCTVLDRGEPSRSPLDPEIQRIHSQMFIVYYWLEENTSIFNKVRYSSHFSSRRLIISLPIRFLIAAAWISSTLLSNQRCQKIRCMGKIFEKFQFNIHE